MASVPRHVLWLRPDAVGDTIMALAMLPHLARRWPGVRITAVCQEVVAPLYQACPHVAEVVSFVRPRAIQEQAYLSALLSRVAQVGADLCLHSVHSREALGDLLARASGAREIVGFGGDLCNMPAEQHQALDGIYTRLLPPEPATSLEVDRHRAFLRALGCSVDRLEPALWTTAEDEAAAQAILAGCGLQAREALAVFPGSTAATRMVPALGEALRPFAAAGHPLLVIGSEAERALGDQILRQAGGRGWNLCQSLPLRTTAALLRRCRLAVGVESGLVQLACAVGLPNVVAYGGAFFGRFLPHAPLTSLAMLPLDCFGCDGRCIHPRASCVADLDPGVIGEAIRQALAGPSDRPRLYLQGRWSPTPGGPVHQPGVLSRLSMVTRTVTVEPGGHLAPPASPAPPAPAAVAAAAPAQAPVQPQAHAAAPAPVPSPVVAGGAQPARTTVFCAVWHKDPKRLERLRGHQACLDRQVAPVERVYVFDGGDAPPPWLRGRAVVAREPLGIYEAWNLALTLVRTPYVMNLNLDDRLNPEAVDLYERALGAGADLVGGDWRVCFSQEEADAVEPCAPASALPFEPAWPPLAGRPTRLGSGSGERGTLGPACAWRMSLHTRFPRYPWQFVDGTPLRVIADAVWWAMLQQAGKKVVRLPVLVGHYLSDPSGQAEFRNPGEAEHQRVKEQEISLL